MANNETNKKNGTIDDNGNNGVIDNNDDTGNSRNEGNPKKSHFEFTTRRPVAIIMIVIGIFVFGMVSYKRLSWNLMPDISYPSFTVRTEYPGAAPEEVENVVSRPLEEQLSLIKDLVSITSISRPEQSDIVLEFVWGTNLDRASQEIREKLDQVNLEQTVKKPLILRYDPALDPVLRVGIVSDIPLVDLRVIVEDEIARELESLPGVAAARVKGGFEKEILVKLDEKQLATYQINFNEITTRLAQENINLAGGNIKEGETEYIVRTLNEFRNMAEIGDIIIAKRENVLVRLKDIAEVSYSHKERTVITRVNKKESIEINIYKEADANIVEVSNRVKEKLFGTVGQQTFAKALERRQKEAEKLAGEKKTQPNAEQNPEELMREKQMTDFLQYRLASQGLNIEYNILSDQSIFIENSINEVKSTAVMGGILAIIVLYLFLCHFGTTVIVAVSIPLSLIAAFAPLQLFNVSLNIMSLGGLALGVGMLVDNSIVVMESIFRCREEGDEWVASVIRGVDEVGGAVVSSTLTTVAVFFPIVFVEGIAGQIFGDLSLAVVFSLLASLLVSLYFIPMLASRKFEKTNPLLKKFGFAFEENHTVKNFSLIPVEMVRNIFVLIRNFVLVLLLMFLATLFVFLYPLLALFRVHTHAVKLMQSLVSYCPAKRTNWDDFFRVLPFEQYVQSMGNYKFILGPLPWVYYLFRYFVVGLFFMFVRLLLTLLGAGIVFFKGLVLLFIAVLGPVIQFLLKGFTKILNAVNRYYPKLLALSLRNATQIIAVMVVVFLFSIFIVMPRIGSELIPEVHQGTLYVNVAFPVGTPVDKNDQLLQQFSQKIETLPHVKNISYYSGTTKDEINEDEVGEHIGRITVVLEASGNVKTAEDKVILGIRKVLQNFTDLDYNISRPVMFTMKPPIEVILKGYNLDDLRRVNNELLEKIAAVPGLKDVQSTVKVGFPELVVEFDRMRLSHYGLNAYDVASIIKNKIEGYVATKYKEKDRRVDIRVYLKDDQRKRAENISELIVNPGGPVPIQLKSVARVEILSGPNEIRRVDQDRCAIISANISNISLTAAVKKIYSIVDRYPMPPGVTYELSGQNKEMETSLGSLTLAMVLAIFLVYIVMASQFESFLHPFLIMFTIPMALIGVIFTLYIMGIPFGVTVYIGMITLVGVVVNNAIILIDYINTLRKRGMEKIAAIKLAGAVRLRPILITTLTTVLGLFPMALGLGEGAEIRTPMAITIIAGLSCATFLTLVLIPIVYSKFSK